jgi:hypothetical protein
MTEQWTADVLREMPHRELVALHDEVTEGRRPLPDGLQPDLMCEVLRDRIATCGCWVDEEDSTDHLIAFLRARYDEEHQRAQQQWIDVPELSDMGKPESEWPRVPGRGPDEAKLREVESKRRILDELYPEIDRMGSMIDGEWGGYSDQHEILLKLLALPYADHEGYKSGWRA